MRGDDRTRHCARCRLNVYNVKALSEAEVRALFAAGGQVCGRIFQRPDGTVLTRDCPVGLARIRRRFVVAVTASLALVVSAFALRPSSFGQHAIAGRADFSTRLAVTRDRAETWLRGTRTFGPLIEWLDPLPPMMAGKMVLRSPPAPAPGGVEADER